MATASKIDAKGVGQVALGAAALYAAWRLFGPEPQPDPYFTEDMEPPTFTRQQARLAAEGIFAAIYGDGGFWTGNTAENEAAVIAILKTCRNTSDVFLVIDAYGIRGGSWSWSGEMNLPAAITQYLSASDRQEVNDYYAAHGIEIAF